MTYELSMVAATHCGCGENPLYDAAKNRLLWTDIPHGRLFELDLNSGQWRQFYDGETVGGFTLQSDGALLLFREHNIARLDANGALQVLAADVAPAGGRFNDVIATPNGEVFAGTMGRDGDNGGLYRVRKNGEVSQLWSGTECANGQGFSPDLKQFYWADTPKRTIFRYDYNSETGELGAAKTFFVARENTGSPDGLTIDSEGNLWVAFWGGSAVHCINPQGEVSETIEMPMKNPTSCAFGTSELNQLFITSAGGPDGGENAGNVYRVSLPVRGRVGFTSRIGLD